MERDREFPDNVTVFFVSLAHSGETSLKEDSPLSSAVILPFHPIFKKRSLNKLWITGRIENDQMKNDSEDGDFDPPAAS